MPRTGIMKGSVRRVYVGAAAVAKATDCSIEFTVGERTVSHKDITTGWGAVDAGEFSATISTSALYSEDDGESFATLWAAFNTKAYVTLKFSTEVAGDKYYTGSFMISNLSINAPNNESVTYTASFKNNGAVSIATK